MMSDTQLVATMPNNAQDKNLTTTLGIHSHPLHYQYILYIFTPSNQCMNQDYFICQ